MPCKIMAKELERLASRFEAAGFRTEAIPLNDLAVRFRRSGLPDYLDVPDAPYSSYSHPSFEYFPMQSVVVVEGREKNLTQMENRFLMIMTEKENQVVLKEEIGLWVWRESFTKAINFRIKDLASRVRRKLGFSIKDGQGYLITIRGIGLNLINPETISSVSSNGKE